VWKPAGSTASVAHADPLGGGSRRREGLWLAGFSVPALLLVVGVQLFPFLYSAFLAVQDWSLLRSPQPKGFAGVDNFLWVLADPVFQVSVRNSVMITGVSVVAEVVLGILLAYLTSGSTWRLRAIRTVLILPMVIAPVAAGTLWRMLLNTQSGLVAVLSGTTGLPSPEWLSDPAWARIAVIMLDVWQWTPFVMLVVVAGLAGIPGEVLEAAAIDGATRWQSFWRVELPLLMPVILVAVMFRTLDSLLSLDSVYSLTAGGPGYSTHTITYYIYNLGLRNFDFGVAAAASWMFMAFTTVVIVVMFRLHRRVDVA
jgi:multiple sugar transport system permease protein